MEKIVKFTKIISKLTITILISISTVSFGMKNTSDTNSSQFRKIKDKKLNFTIEDISPDCKYAVSTHAEDVKDPNNLLLIDRSLAIYNLHDLSLAHRYEQMHQKERYVH